MIANWFGRTSDGIKKRVIWPVKPEFLYVGDYLINSSKLCSKRYLCGMNDAVVEYVSTESEFPFKDIYNNTSIQNIIDREDLLFIPLHGHQLLDSSVMKSKYKLVNLPWQQWGKYFNYFRNVAKERELFYERLGLKDEDKYVFVNQKYASPPDVLIKPFSLNCGDMKQVHLSLISGFTLFDWSMVLENATNIVTVETSLNYLCEFLRLKADKMLMLSKWEPPDFHHIEGLFKKPWKYMI